MQKKSSTATSVVHAHMAADAVSDIAALKTYVACREFIATINAATRADHELFALLAQNTDIKAAVAAIYDAVASINAAYRKDAARKAIASKAAFDKADYNVFIYFSIGSTSSDAYSDAYLTARKAAASAAFAARKDAASDYAAAAYFSANVPNFLFAPGGTCLHPHDH